jgi:hypothetical protein
VALASNHGTCSIKKPLGKQLTVPSRGLRPTPHECSGLWLNYLAISNVSSLKILLYVKDSEASYISHLLFSERALQAFI